MTLLINFTNLTKGGALQVADSFINELRLINDKNEYLVCYTKTSLPSLDCNQFDNRFKFFLFDSSPARLYKRYSIEKKLNSIVRVFHPGVVFTLFGPSYWCPNIPHVMGFADGWVYNPNSLAFARLNSLEQVKRRLLSYYKIKRLKCEGDHFILETDDAREKFINLLDLHDNDVTTVSNTYNSVFDEMPEKPSPLFDKNTFNLLTISAHYPNKNLEIINKVLAHLPSEIKVKFYLTLPNDVFMSIIRKSDRVINLGVQSINDCPVLLHSCDAVFLPTLLETFSASYPEAMKMNKPILTSDLSFAKSICGEAAEYFNPLDAEDIANKLVSLIGNKTRIEELVKLGRERLKIFPSANQRASKYLDICEKFLKKS